MKLIIAGGRDFEDKKLACRSFIDLTQEITAPRLSKINPIKEIVSGGARGADEIGEYVAAFFGLPVKRFIPDWDGLGKRAGFVRNAEMAEYGDVLLAFWDKKSKGTEHMIATARKKGLRVKVVHY